MKPLSDRSGATALEFPRLALLVVALFGVIVCLHIGSALAGKSLIRPSHLGVALNYARGEIDLLRPMMPGFNVNGVPTAQELPIWQAAAGLAFKLAGSEWYGWANVTSLLLFSTALWPLFILARLYAGTRAAWWALAFFLAQPLIVFMAGQASTDGFSLAVTIWFLYWADKLVRGGCLWCVLPAAFFGAVSALSKLPFFMAVGLCSAALLLIQHPRAWRRWLLLAAVGACAGLALMAWTRYTNGLAEQAEYPYYDLRLAENPHLQQWFFGDLKSRLNPGAWVKGGWRYLHATLGVLPLAALLVMGLRYESSRIARWWLASTFAVTLVFTPVVLNHWHYFLMCCPPVAIACGVAVARWEPFWAREMPQAWMRMALAFMALAGCVVNGLVTMKISLDYDPFPKQIAALLQEHTSPKDKLVIYGEPGWGGEILFRSGRAGLSVYDLDTPAYATKTVGLRQLLSEERHLSRLKELGFTKVVMLSESLVRFAVQASNPGGARPRESYPRTVSAAVDAWPVVYQSDDIIIRQIP